MFVSMMHQFRFIFLCSLLCIASIRAATDGETIEASKLSTQSTSTETSVKVSSSEEVNGAEHPFETSHKIHHEFQTSHRISDEALKQHQQQDLHQSMRSKEKPELNEQLGELIAADIKNNIETKRLSEYEHYVVEPLATTTEKPVLTTTSTVAQRVNEGLIDDFSILEEAGTENKQTSRIQIKKGPNGQDYEYEYVYYYYDDDEKNPEDDDIIIGSRKGPSSTTTQASSGKSRYSNIERGSSTSAPERNEIQSRGKARAQALPAPVVEEIVEERLPQATRFPQRAKSANPSENAPETSKKQHVKRPSLELVDSHSFVTDEKSSKGPRIVESELSRSELTETVSKSTFEYASSTTESSFDNEDEEEDTTPLMEKFAIDLYAILANENAREDDKKNTSSETSPEASTETTKPKNRFSRPSSSFGSRNSAARTSKTTSAPEEVKENVEKTEAPSLSSSRLGSKSRNRFSLRNKESTTTTEKTTDTESSTTASRLVKPRPQFSLRNRGRNSQTTTTTEATDVSEDTEEKEEKAVEKATSIVPRPTSRLNINRPGSRLLPGQKARTSPLNARRVTTNDENNDGNKLENENESDPETTTPNNLNKLKSRPRIQINGDSKAKKTSNAVVVNRKVNPLISKRKFGVTSTTEATAEDDKSAETESDNNNGKEGGSESEEVKDDETTQAAEATSEQPARGLGLLNRRKIVNRRPGTIN
ncbi:CLUMA_CG019464, isoform A [Clunio marinus]|uniref:CLUMA_CG019464, isoform A n=1 Tax=Clunio marinus TaxID=568069 RepID=A0A1J1J5J4_9DIPT|nr:CLUMA_CG019464, isoform A [Clunio marinus]